MLSLAEPARPLLIRLLQLQPNLWVKRQWPPNRLRSAQPQLSRPLHPPLHPPLRLLLWVHWTTSLVLCGRVLQVLCASVTSRTSWLVWQMWVLCNGQCWASWPGDWLSGMPKTDVFSWTLYKGVNVQICVLVLLIELYMFIPLSFTLTVFQGHRSVKQVLTEILCFYPVKLKLLSTSKRSWFYHLFWRLHKFEGGNWLVFSFGKKTNPLMLAFVLDTIKARSFRLFMNIILLEVNIVILGLMTLTLFQGHVSEK